VRFHSQTLFLRLPRRSIPSDADQPAPEAGTWFQVRLLLSGSNLPSGPETDWLYSIPGILYDAGDQGESAFVKCQVLPHMVYNKRSDSSDLYVSKSTIVVTDLRKVFYIHQFQRNGFRAYLQFKPRFFPTSNRCSYKIGLHWLKISSFIHNFPRKSLRTSTSSSLIALRSGGPMVSTEISHSL
jgi:hypothetical protein